MATIKLSTSVNTHHYFDRYNRTIKLAIWSTVNTQTHKRTHRKHNAVYWMNFLISAKLLYSLVLLVPTTFQPEIFRLLRLIFSLKPAVTGFQLGDQYPCHRALEQARLRWLNWRLNSMNPTETHSDSRMKWISFILTVRTHPYLNLYLHEIFALSHGKWFRLKSSDAKVTF